MLKAYKIRAAQQSDISKLYDLRKKYVSVNYGSMLSDAFKSSWDETSSIQVDTWFQDSRYDIGVIETDDSVEGYIVYGMDGEGNRGVILEARAVQSCDAEHKKLLIEYALKQMIEQSAEIVRIWLQHDNFRIRFLFESLGFHRNGTMKKDNRHGYELAYDEYIYEIKRKE